MVTAVDGKAAHAEFARVQPDLVLLDVMMPHFTGFEVCRQLKGNPQTWPQEVIAEVNKVIRGGKLAKAATQS